MNNNENVVSFELDTTKIDQSIEKLKEALPNSFNKEIERIKKSVDSLNKQTESMLIKQAKQQAKEQERANKELQQQLLKQEKEKAKEQLQIQKALLLAKAKEEAKAQKELQRQLIAQEREKAKQREQELKNKHKEALQKKQKDDRADDLKARIKQDRQELKARILAKTPLKPQANQYTKSLKDLQEQHKALQTDYAKLNDKDPTELKNKQKDAIKKQQENLNEQAYHIKQVRLQNQSPLLEAEQKKANRNALNQQVELYNKQKQNTIKNAMNIDKTANNIKEMAKNLTEQKTSFSLLKDTIKEVGASKITLGLILGKIASMLFSYDNLKYSTMDIQRYANKSQTTLDQSRVIKEVSKQYSDPQLMQVFNVLGNLKSNMHLNNLALGMIGLSREELLKHGIFDRFNMLMLSVKKFMKNATPQSQGILNEMLTQSLGVSQDWIKETTAMMNKNGIDFSVPIYKALIESDKFLKNQKQKITNQEIFDPIFKNTIESANKNLQSQQSELFKVDILARASNVTNNWLQNIHAVITNIYSIINNASKGNSMGVLYDLKTLLGDTNYTNTPNTTTPINKSIVTTNKANQGMPQ